MGLIFFSAICAMDANIGVVLAQSNQGKPINVYVGYATGGNYDLTARLVARHMGRHIPGEPNLIVQNMPGAGGLKLANFLYTVAPRDGSAFGIIGPTLALAPLLNNEGVQFDSLKFTWIGSTANEVSTCVAWHTAPVKTAEDLYTQELIVGATGTTSVSALYPKILNAVLGMKFKVVQGYTGSADALLAMERGETQGFCGLGWINIAQKEDWVQNRKVNVLVQLGLDKYPRPIQDGVPLALDLAKGQENRQVLELTLAPQVFARPFLAPPALPAGSAETLRQAFRATLADRAFLAEAEKQKFEIELVTHDQIEALLARLYAYPKPVIQRAKVIME